MPDIFLSYTRKNRPTARKLANGLKDSDWDVWWDEHIPAGEQFDRIIESILPKSTCIVVLWSTESVDSDFVRSEARWAKEHGRLIPVFIDRVNLPIEFSAHQTIDMVDWPNAGHEGYNKLLATLQQRIKKGIPKKAVVHKTPSRSLSKWWLFGVPIFGLWPIVSHIFVFTGDDQFLFAPMLMAVGLIILAYLRPIAPLLALGFTIIPFMLNLFAFYFFELSSFRYHLANVGIIVDIVALIGTMAIVYAICKYKSPRVY